MATFADHALEERRRLRQRRKPKPGEITDVLTAPGSLSAGQSASVGAQGVRPGSLRPGTVSGVTIRNGTLTANKIVAHSITADEIKAGTITANEIDVGNLTADTIFTDTLAANDAFIGNLKSNFIGVYRLEADNIMSNSITSVHINTVELFAADATIAHLQAGLIEAGGLVLAGTIGAGSVHAGLIGSGTIVAAQINVGGSGSVATAQIRALDMADHVRATMDASGFQTYDAAGNVMWSASSGVTSWGISPHSVYTVHIQTGGMGSEALMTNAVITDHILAYNVLAGKIAGDQIVAAHVLGQTFTGLNIYASGFSNSAADSLKKFVLDTNGIHIRTSNNATSTYQFLDFFDGGFATRAWICYDYFSGFDQLRVGMVGKMLINATRLDVETTVRIAGVCRIVGSGGTNGEFQVEGPQIGLYVVIRARAAAAAHWYGTHCQFRGRRVDGGGSGAAPGSLTITQTLQSNLVTAWDIVSTTSYGSMISVGSTAGGDIFYAIHVSTS